MLLHQLQSLPGAQPPDLLTVITAQQDAEVHKLHSEEGGQAGREDPSRSCTCNATPHTPTPTLGGSGKHCRGQPSNTGGVVWRKTRVQEQSATTRSAEKGPLCFFVCQQSVLSGQPEGHNWPPKMTLQCSPPIPPAPYLLTSHAQLLQNHRQGDLFQVTREARANATRSVEEVIHVSEKGGQGLSHHPITSGEATSIQ